jgi:hypothetical protein
MSFPPPKSAEDVIDQPARVQFEVFLDEHRSELNACLDGLSEEQVRRSLVRREGLVRRSRHMPVTGRDRHPRGPGRVVHAS